MGIAKGRRRTTIAYTKRETFHFEINKECEEGKFTSFKDGPSIMNVKSLEERINKIETGQINQE